MKRILVPTDFSEHADEALKLAAKIAKKNGSKIFLLNLLELPRELNDSIKKESNSPELMVYIKKANEKLQKIKEQPYLKGITISTTVQFERAFDGILSFNKKNKIDLIVMGSHGSTGIEEILIGSNTEKIVRLSEIPVLVVKKGSNTFNIKNIVFASDFSEETKKPFIKMIEFAKIFDASLNLVMMCTPNSFKTTVVAQNIMKNFISDFKLENYSIHIYNDYNIEKGIINFTNMIGADLIGLCTHGRTGLSHYFYGSISEDIVNHTIKPIITFKI